MNVIAHTDLICVSSSGAAIPVTVKIGEPYSLDEGDMACPVSVDGLENSLPDIVSVDAISSVRMAIDFARSILQTFTATGGKIYYTKDVEKVEVEATPIPDAALL